MSGCVVASAMVTSAGAYRVSKTNVGTFEWYTYSAATTNKTNTSRMTDACIAVYEDNTGIQVDTITVKNTGAYDSYAKAYNYNYPSSQYNFEIYGHVYNSTASQSSSLWFTGIKTLD